ncbi:gastrula zinc finger protein xFG20-1-like isoform X2 [Anopheles bellator]|uniref:gastrula zinc finger protein xFG20-1-like isoform X2 n=1 Tax=Anopheles bellator TaxID=139047 RepID=UPI0026488BAE|nr:gastrula zinc finger protein xFG20-1-like isoform X2 [Anopheles bellator]
MDVETRIIKEETCLDTAGGGGTEVPEDDGGGGEGSRAAATDNNNELPDEEGDHHPHHHPHHHHHHRRRPSKTVYSLNMNVCRLCLCEGHDNLQPVFYGKDELDAVLQQKIHELTTVEITYATDFPTAVCVDCLTKLEEWAIYRRQCIDNNEMLRVKYLELKSELDCYREPHTTDPDNHQQYQQRQQELRRSPAVKEEQEVLRLMDEDEGDTDGQMNGEMTCEEPTGATSYGHELDADGNEIIIGADGATTKIQYVNEDGTMTEYVTAAPGAVIRRSASAAGLDDQQQQQEEELRIDGDGDPYADDGPQDDDRHEIYYTVGTDGAYAIHANAAGYAGAPPGSYVPQGFENQTEIETTIQEHLPEEYVEEGVISPAGLLAAGATAGPPAMMATSTRGAHDRPFVCKHCKTSFKYEHNYDRHMKNHAKVLYRCGKCSKTFVKLRKCQQHFMKAHSSQRYECDICFRTYSLPTRLENHVIEMHSKNGVYSCDRCRGEQFASYLDFKAHRMTQHPRNNDNTGGTGGGSVGSDATIPAIIKQTAYGDVVHMQQILTPLGTPFEDPDGDAGSPSSDGAEMEAHDGRNNRRGSNSKPSPVGKSRSGPTGVARARRPNGRLVGAGGKKTSPRKQVSMIPSQQQEVILIDDDEQQQQQHNNGMELNGAGSSGLDASGNALHRQLLQQIEESEANSLGPKLYPCESCSQTFAHLNNLKAHIYAEHDNDKPFKCKLCPISFKTKEILVMHMLLHSQHSSTI